MTRIFQIIKKLIEANRAPPPKKKSLQGKRCFVPNSIVVDSLTFASALHEIRGHPKWYTLVVLYGDAWKCRAILGIHSRCRSWMIMTLSQHVCQHFSSGIHTMQQTSKLNQLQLRPQEKTTSSQGRCVFFFPVEPSESKFLRQIWWSELKSFEQLLIQIFRIGSLEPHTWFLITCKKKPHLEKKADTWNIPSSHISFLGGVWYHLHVGVRWVYGASMHPTKRGVTGLLMLYLKTNETKKIQQLQVEIILKQQTQTFMSTFHFHQQRFWQPRKNKVEYIPRCSPVFQGQQGFSVQISYLQGSCKSCRERGNRTCLWSQFFFKQSKRPKGICVVLFLQWFRDVDFWCFFSGAPKSEIW